MKKWLVRNIAQACMRILEMMSIIHDEECRAFGGYMQEGYMLRLCDKDRWHTDSHSYEDIMVNQAWRPPHKIYVLAANYQHFNTWCRISGLDSFSKNIVFLTSVRQLMGANFEADTFIYYETWTQHPEHRNLDNYIKSIRTA